MCIRDSDEIGGRKIVFHLLVGNKAVVKNHVLLQAVVGDLAQVTLLRGVEFAGDDEFAPFLSLIHI